jgi:hypothetical protein
VTPDPRPRARHRARQREWAELHRAKHGRCRICGRLPTQLHHLVARSQSGDDTADNLVPLCSDHHSAVHAGDLLARTLLGGRLTDAEVGYVVDRRGAAWLEERYPEPLASFRCRNPEGAWVDMVREETR